MNLRKLKKFLSTGAAVAIAAAAVPTAASAVDQQETGYFKGYSWEMWNQESEGTVSMKLTDSGFECSWDNIYNCIFNKGFRYNGKPTKYKQLGNIRVEYEMDYTMKGNSFYGVYGWTENPLAEYYIVEGWGDWRPPGSMEKKGVVTLDGNVYDICKTMRYNQPCIMGTASFPTYWSVRQTSASVSNATNHLSGSVSVSEHFKAWDNAGFDMTGKLYNIVFNVEGYRSSGTADVKKLRITPAALAPDPITPDEDGYYIKESFDSGNKGSFDTNGNGSMYIMYMINDSESRGYSLEFDPRYETKLNRVSYPLDMYTFKPGQTYSIGAAVRQKTSDTSEFRILFRYMDSSGNIHFDVVADSMAEKDKWTDISNTSYTMPDFANAPSIYIELLDSDSNFFIDDFYIGVDGTKPLADDLSDTVNKVIVQGDINNDGVVDVFDLPAMRNVLIGIFAGSSQPHVNADLNGDGDVNIADLVLLHKYLFGTEKKFAEPVTTTAATTTTTTTTTTTATDVSETTTEVTASAATASEITTETTEIITTAEVTTNDTSKTTTIATTTLTETTVSEPTTVGTTTEEKPSTTTKVYVNYNEQIRKDMPTNVPSNAQKSSKCKVEKKTYTCKFTGMEKSCNVILPPDYDANKEYPVMYVLHGIGGDENSMLNGMGVQELLTGLTASGEAEEMIIVLPSQYTSKDANGVFGINQETCAAYDNFLYDISDSLIPYIEENYPVKTGRENRAVTGFSMGGREAIYIGLMRPDLFGYVGGACPAPGITPGKDMFMEHPGCMTESEMKFRDVGPEPAVFMITGGTNDAVVGSFPQQYSDILTKNGVDHVYQSIPGGGHDGNSVKPHLYTFMRYAFK